MLQGSSVNVCHWRATVGSGLENEERAKKAGLSLPSPSSTEAQIKDPVS
jgi:hypothetical protein